jgi:hypothetical protein
MRYLRMYADQHGDSHIEDAVIEMFPTGFGGSASAQMPSTHVFFRSSPVGFFTGDPSPADSRKLVWILSGEVEITVSDGTVQRVGPGSLVLVEDTWGKGYSVREVGSEGSFQAVVELSD